MIYRLLKDQSIYPYMWSTLGWALIGPLEVCSVKKKQKFKQIKHCSVDIFRTKSFDITTHICLCFWSGVIVLLVRLGQYIFSLSPLCYYMTEKRLMCVLFFFGIYQDLGYVAKYFIKCNALQCRKTYR